MPPLGVSLTVCEPWQLLGARSLRRFAQRVHRMVDWRAREPGGPEPGIEQPDQLLEALTQIY